MIEARGKGNEVWRLVDLGGTGMEASGGQKRARERELDTMVSCKAVRCNQTFEVSRQNLMGPGWNLSTQ